LAELGWSGRGAALLAGTCKIQRLFDGHDIAGACVVIRDGVVFTSASSVFLD
jgi:hypothetical protein